MFTPTLCSEPGAIHRGQQADVPGSEVKKVIQGSDHAEGGSSTVTVSSSYDSVCLLGTLAVANISAEVGLGVS